MSCPTRGSPPNLCSRRRISSPAWSSTGTRPAGARCSGLGITDLPDYNRADLSALTDLDAFLSEAKQLARVKVDEEGVEAAAVTILSVKNLNLPPQSTEVCVMDLDRPFLFVIRAEGVPLFVGVVNQVHA